MKKLIALLLLVSGTLLAFSSCSHFWKETLIKDVFVRPAFENETWLLMEDRLISKEDGSVFRLQPDKEKEIAGVTEVHYLEVPTYHCVFHESSFEQHTFLKVFLHSSNPDFYECVLTYGYDGKEIDRTVVEEPLTREQMKALFNERLSDASASAAFTFWVEKGVGGASDASDRAEVQAILAFAKDRYGITDDTSLSTVDGLARQMGEELWFSANVSNRRGSVTNHPDPLIDGIYASEVIAYDPKRDAFRTVCPYNQKRTQIVDFDENGIYTLDLDRTLAFYDYETQESTPIHAFAGAIDHFTVTDSYIFVEYVSNGCGCLVYQKGGAVIANRDGGAVVKEP